MMYLSFRSARSVLSWKRPLAAVQALMGVPISTKKATNGSQITYEQSFASFSTTGTLPSSIIEGQCCVFDRLRASKSEKHTVIRF